MPIPHDPSPYIALAVAEDMPMLLRLVANRCRELSRGARTADESAALWEAGDGAADLAADLHGTLVSIDEARGFPSIVGRKHEVTPEIKAFMEWQDLTWAEFNP